MRRMQRLQQNRDVGVAPLPTVAQAPTAELVNVDPRSAAG